MHELSAHTLNKTGQDKTRLFGAKPLSRKTALKFAIKIIAKNYRNLSFVKATFLKSGFNFVYLDMLVVRRRLAYRKWPPIEILGVIMINRSLSRSIVKIFLLGKNILSLVRLRAVFFLKTVQKQFFVRKIISVQFHKDCAQTQQQ